MTKTTEMSKNYISPIFVNFVIFLIFIIIIKVRHDG